MQEMATTTMWEASRGVESRPHMKEEVDDHRVDVHQKRWALPGTEDNQPDVGELEGNVWNGPTSPYMKEKMSWRKNDEGPVE